MTEPEHRLAYALAWMCEQYLKPPAGEGLDHEYMSAGEDALGLLAEYGFVELEPRGGQWTDAGQALLNGHAKNEVRAIEGPDRQ